MPDREKVIKGLEKHLERDDKKCPYYGRYDCTETILFDALQLMKQEHIKPMFVGNDEWECPECETIVGWKELDCGGVAETKYKYCPGCGRKVKWDDTCRR